MTDRLGTVVINEQVFPLDRVFLGNGEVCVEFVAPAGRGLDVGDGVYSVFDPNGVLVYTGKLTDNLVPAVKDLYHEWRITLGLTITDRISERARAHFTRST